ncbi:MAG: hypothetical protein AAGA20_22510 [Planctomycetota bacterium]
MPSNGPDWIRRSVLVASTAALLFLVGALVRTTWMARSATGIAWGWDESMHAELPAVRMLLHVGRGELGAAFDVVLGCDRYPFVHPLALAGWQGLFGIGEHQARTLGLFLFSVLLLAGLARLARRVALDGREQADTPATLRSVSRDAALFAALAGAASPLARRYAPTLYLEIPALVGIVFALEAWLARRTAASRRRADVVAGLWIAVAFFTKFNYGLMLVAALGLDALVSIARSEERRAEFASSVMTFAPLALASLWWFVLPLPGGASDAALHREAFMGFVTGNTALGPTAGWLRRVNWLTGVAPHPVLFAALTGLGLLALATLRARTASTMLLVLAVFVLPVVLHPFHLDRFLLPASAIIWTLGAVGAARVLGARPVAFLVAASAVALTTLALDTFRIVTWAGLPAAEEGTPTRAYQEQHVSRALGVFAPPAANGLERQEHDALLDLVAGAVGPTARVAWIGQSSEVSPAALHLGLLERRGDPERFLRDAHRPMDLTPVPELTPSDHGPDDVLAFAAGFDAAVLCEGGDLKDRAARRWVVERWHQPLLASDRFEVRDLGAISIARPNQAPLSRAIRLASPR